VIASGAGDRELTSRTKTAAALFGRKA